MCFITGQGIVGGRYFDEEVDGGPFTLTSPPVATGGNDARISYARWFYNSVFNPGDEDFLVVELSGDGGQTWVDLEVVPSQGAHWVFKEFRVSDVITPPDSVTLRFTVEDCPNGAIIEAAVDDVSITTVGCVDCPTTNAPLQDPAHVSKNRYISFTPGNPGRQTGIRVTLSTLPPPHDTLNGTTMWVGPPQEVSENAGVVDPIAGSPNFTAATLQCEPFVTDWDAHGTLHVYHEGIIPGGSYAVQEIDSACLAGDVPAFSSSLIQTMSRWGDVAASTVGGVWLGPDGSVDIVTDVVAVIEKFSNRPGAPSKIRADIEPAIPDQRINISDVTRILDGFRNLPYPFPAVPDPCAG